MQSIVVDNFAGGGGASTGIEAALGRPVDFAINHDAEAIAMHKINHPDTHHYITNVWDVDPRELSRGRPVELGWFSPDCTFHSKARGGKPFRDRNTARRRRGLAWLIQRWVKALGPDAPNVIMLENVEEFADWGPLLADGTPDPKRRGQTFRKWHRELENLGYSIDMRELRAASYGAPTWRKRLFIVMRRDGKEIIFPEATHGPGLTPYRTAAECIDWTIPCPSIFDRERPLSPKTMARIARGTMRYVVNSANPFIVTLRGTDDAHITSSASSIDEPLRTISANGQHHALVAPTIINTRNGEREGQAPRCRDILTPFPTVTAQGSQGALVCAFLARHYGGHENDGAPMDAPFHTVTTKDHHALVYAFLMSYYGTDQAPSLHEPAPTVRCRDHLGVVTVNVGGEPRIITDIGMRMLTPRELFNAQGFGRDYIINPKHNGKRLTQTAQIRMAGNSVAPDVARALVQANVIDQREAA